MPLLDDILFTENQDWRIIYWCRPPEFRDFVTSKEHLHLPPLSERQYQALFKLIGEDPLKIFSPERKKHIGVYLLGKGSGKDYMVSILCAYLLCVLLCMVNVHEFFNFPQDENIDILNVAPTAFQAREVFFNKLKSRILNWKWFLGNFKVTWRGKAVRGSKGTRMEVRITDTSIETANNIRFNSLHAEAENYEGFNVLVAILDETSAYEDKFEEVVGSDGDMINVGKADLIYNTLRTSAVSRKLPWLMALISFPRRLDDFTVKKYEEAMKDPDGIMIAERGCTWEFNPRYFGEETFRFEEWEVPISFKADFEGDPVNSKMKYCTVPPTVLNRFFYSDERIQSAIDDNLKPLLVLDDDNLEMIDANGKKVKFVVKKILSSNLVDRTKAYAAGVDLSIIKDRTIVVIGHGEPCDIRSTFISVEGQQELTTIHTRVIIDQIIIWEPDIKKKLQVSHINVDEVLEHVHGLTGFSYISYDQYQSQYVLEKALRAGIISEKHNINDKDYVLFRNMLTAGAISYPRNKLLLFEMERLIFDGKRVQHLPIFSKDVCDAVCHVIRAIAGGYAKAMDTMVFTFAEDSMFDPSAATDPFQGMPNLPKEALMNTAKELNPNDYNIFF